MRKKLGFFIFHIGLLVIQGSVAIAQSNSVQKKPPIQGSPTQTRWRSSVGLAFTNLNYSQTGVSPFTERFITIRGGLEKSIPGTLWSFGGSFFFNALELANTGVYQLRILGVNLRMGRFLTSPESVVQVRLNGGVYYNTSISEIGFKNMVGPQIFPEFSSRISKRSSIMTYLKYSPVLVAGSFDIIRNREVATGLYFRQQIYGTKSWFVGIDYASLEAKAEGDEASARTISFGIGLGF